MVFAGRSLGFGPHPRPVGQPLSINGEGDGHLPTADVIDLARGNRHLPTADVIDLARGDGHLPTADVIDLARGIDARGGGR